ncbi:hypothetical protein TrVGV298_010397 [Trichoderma virens]|nr:hypothetical protein TrVGV298_010397 [Trichoderma virens]
MERRGLCSVDPRHAVARLLQATKRAGAEEDEKGADCRDGEKHGRLPDVEPTSLGNNGSREQREPARQFVQDPRGEAVASVQQAALRRTSTLLLKWNYSIRIASLDLDLNLDLNLSQSLSLNLYPAAQQQLLHGPDDRCLLALDLDLGSGMSCSDAEAKKILPPGPPWSA